MKRLISSLVAIVYLPGCAVWPIGEDPKGKALRVQAEAVVSAIIAYDKKNGVLPETIDELVPEFLGSLPEVANHSVYRPKQGELAYIYSPTWPQQGRTSCGTKIGSGKWGCHGYI